MQDRAKTNAARILDLAGIEYRLHEYGKTEDFLSGSEVAALLGVAADRVFKTLVTRGNSGNVYVCVIPSNIELDLKKTAKMFAEKKVDMIPVKEILPLTGDIKGGCSPIGMKKRYKTAIDKSANKFDKIFCSAGKRGVQVELKPFDLAAVTGAEFAELTERTQGKLGDVI